MRMRKQIKEFIWIQLKNKLKYQAAISQIDGHLLEQLIDQLNSELRSHLYWELEDQIKDQLEEMRYI